MPCFSHFSSGDFYGALKINIINEKRTANNKKLYIEFEHLDALRQLKRKLYQLLKYNGTHRILYYIIGFM